MHRVSPPERPHLATYLAESCRFDARAAFVLRTPVRVRRVSLAEARELAYRFAHLLASEGLRKGDRIVLWGPTSPEWAAAFLGAMASGIVIVPLDDAAGPAFAARVQQKVRARLAVVGRAALEQAAAALPGVRLVVMEDLGREVEGRPAEQPRVELEAADTLEIVFTSGTTSEPKGVVLSHRNVLAVLAPIEHVFRTWDRRAALVRRRPIVSLLPLSHMFGQNVGLFIPLLMGLTAVYVESPSPAAIRQALREEGAFVLMAVPRFLPALRREWEAHLERRGKLARHLARREALAHAPFWRRLLAFPGARRYFGFRMAAIVVGGAALDPAEERAWRSMGYLVVPGYGLTETAPVITLGNPFAAEVGAVGRPLPGQEVRLGPGGEVLVRGANVTEGYFEGDGRVRPVVDADGWFHTGDVGELDAKGRLRILGRSKDVIVLPSGLNVFARDVERVLDEDDAVAESAVVGVPGADGEEVHAVLLLRDPGFDADEVARAVVARANERLAPYQRVRSFTVWREPALPRTPSTRKVRKRDLVEAVTRGQGQAARSAATAASRIDEILADADETKKLGDLDLSSLDVLELVGRIEGEYQVAIDDASIGTETTVAALKRRVSERGAGARGIPMTRWARTPLARAVGAALRWTLAYPSLLAFTRPRVEGREHLASVEGPALFVGNHLSYFDAPTIYLALPARLSRRLAAAMAPEPFAPLFTSGGTMLERARQAVRYVLATLAFTAFPMPRAAGFRASLAYAGEMVDRGFSVLIYPEGRMSRTGEVGEFRGGAGLLATGLGVPVVPFRTRGLEVVWPAGAGFPRRGPVSVRFGPPLRFEPNEDRQAATRRIEEAVRAL